MPMATLHKIRLDNVEKELEYFWNSIGCNAVYAIQRSLDKVNRMFKANIEIAGYSYANSFLQPTNVSNGLDDRLADELSLYTGRKFRHGSNRTEVDMVCDENPRLNFEFKASAVEDYNNDGRLKYHPIPFGMTNSGGDTEKKNKNTKYNKKNVSQYHYCVYLRYHMPESETDNFEVLEIYIGIYKPNDLKNSTKNSKSAYFSKEKFKEQFRRIYWKPGIL
jgi:hypothetical protein